jgi:hypothetical protein
MRTRRLTIRALRPNEQTEVPKLLNVTNVRGGVLSVADQFAPLRRKLAAPADAEDAADKDDAPHGPAETPAADPLEEAARRERDYLREHLRQELGREPSEAEVSDYLRRHTEGY